LVSLFVYGTLMDGARVQAVVGRRLPSRAAVLEGFERLEPAGSYPYVVPREGATVSGILLDEVDDTALARLDAYEDEGGLYLRREAVAVADGKRVPCQVYVGNGIREARGRA
jgi:gamma-glutamylcyclotransferase (GGCT)/AIG2-like uncharacterized protein YtfP